MWFQAYIINEVILYYIPFSFTPSLYILFAQTNLQFIDITYMTRATHGQGV
jgi:hypothetical protein